MSFFVYVLLVQNVHQLITLLLCVAFSVVDS